MLRALCGRARSLRGQQQQRRLFHGAKVPHFTLTRETTVEESRLQCSFYEHDATGAQIMHIAADDPNNFFACGFATQPVDSTGVAHILEHTVLCGSARFPVRDPFFNMMKRSLSTYMNALTGPDFTIYPFGSLNETDYHNLMQVAATPPPPQTTAFSHTACFLKISTAGIS
jgi:presequence protease